MSLHEFLRDCDEHYSADLRMVCRQAKTPGYHTRIVDGTPAHSTRDAMDYAIALLQSGEVARAERACDVIDRIASMQVTDPTAKHYGIWGWYAEEPPEQMNPADWNWADFIGGRLAQVLVIHAGQLRPETAARARVALHHAAMSIFRRNVTASYTNIAIMGAVVSAAAGELLSLPFLVDYGRTRLGDVVHLVEEGGGFTEYNSPTYTRIGIEETERALLLIKDERVRALADQIRVLEWQALAEHYHPATGQIAGPCSRAYSDWVDARLASYLREQTGVEIPLTRKLAEGRGGAALTPGIACPGQFLPRFRELPEEPHVIVRRFAKHDRGDLVGTTWFSREACLGSISRDTCWTQRRTLLGYWWGRDGDVPCLRARVLCNGRDFAPAYTYQAQDGPRVLSSYCLSYNAGAFHPVFDIPADHRFEVNDLRVRVSLAAEDAQVRPLGNGTFELAAGGWRAVLHTPKECRFRGKPVQWRVAEGLAAVDAVLHDGQAQELDCRTAELELGFGLELLMNNETVEPSRPVMSIVNGDGHWTWRNLKVTCPIAPVDFRW